MSRPRYLERLKLSIVNVRVWPDRALVFVDTAGRNQETGQIHDISKLHVFPHINAVLAGRGISVFITAMYSACSELGGSFDSMAERMPQTLAMVFDGFVQHMLQHGFDAAAGVDVQEIVFVGWSDQSGRVIGHHYRQETISSGFAHSTINCSLISPWHESIPNLPLLTLENAVDWANAQVLMQNEIVPGQATGGSLIDAEITQQSIKVSNVGKLIS